MLVKVIDYYLYLLLNLNYCVFISYTCELYLTDLPSILLSQSIQVLSYNMQLQLETDSYRLYSVVSYLAA